MAGHIRRGVGRAGFSSEEHHQVADMYCAGTICPPIIESQSVQNLSGEGGAGQQGKG